jgi:hypothetical protein
VENQKKHIFKNVFVTEIRVQSDTVSECTRAPKITIPDRRPSIVREQSRLENRLRGPLEEGPNNPPKRRNKLRTLDTSHHSSAGMVSLAACFV